MQAIHGKLRYLAEIKKDAEITKKFGANGVFNG